MGGAASPDGWWRHRGNALAQVTALGCRAGFSTSDDSYECGDVSLEGMTPFRFALEHRVGARSALDMVVMVGMITTCLIQVSS